MAYLLGVLHREAIPNLWLFLLPFSVLILADRSVQDNHIQSMAYVCHGFLPQNSNVLWYGPFLIILNTIYFFLTASENWVDVFTETSTRTLSWAVIADLKSGLGFFAWSYFTVMHSFTFLKMSFCFYFITHSLSFVRSFNSDSRQWWSQESSILYHL